MQAVILHTPPREPYINPPPFGNIDANCRLMRSHRFRSSTPAATGRIILWAALLWGLWIPSGLAQSLTDRLTGNADVPWRISADDVSYDAASSTYHARGNVIIEKQAAKLVADRVAFNQKAMTASASGHVMMTVGEDILTGERVDLDLERQTGVVHDGTVFLQENHFYISGQRIEKTGKDTYRAERASITSCDGDRPDWIITSRTLEVTVEGYGSATHAVLKARQVPILYAPYLLFPAKTKRQTGLLIPEAGASDRQGFFWDQPLFWAISKDSDATFYGRYMSERGVKAGLEYRYALTDASFGAGMADYLNDRQIDDGTPESTEKWGYPGDAYDRTNTDRYWFRAKIDQDLAWGAKARLDLDVVSDQDYLVEFKDGLSGYDASRNYFLEAFGRDLDTYDETVRTNQLNINRTWSRFSLNGNLVWNDNVTARRWEEENYTLQQLPSITFAGIKQQAFDSGIYWDLNSEYAYFYSQDGVRGQRADLYPRAYLPLRWRNYLSVEPSVGWRQTAYAMDRQEDESLDRTNYRQIVDARLDVSTEFSKVMGSPVATVDRIRHSIKPRVIYEYIPDQDQSDLPYFTDLDRIAEVNRVTYSLNNLFTARKARPQLPTAAGSTDGSRPQNPTAPQTFDYHRFCRFYLQQTYDIDAAREDRPQPFSDIYGELDFNLGRYLTVNSNASFDPYASLFSAHNVGAAVADGRGDRLWVEHHYDQDLYESVRATLTVKLTDRLSARGEYERNLLDETDIVKGAGFLYTAQCWSVDFFYAVEGQDNRFSIGINLMGIGGFGQ